jgi:hemolysin D
MNKNSEIIPVYTRRELTKEELQFLPAALEIVETPPSPVGRALSWLLILLFITALAWSLLGMIDEVAVASGKVVPSGYTKIVQAEDKGVVSKILVHNGSKVKAGDLLIELDSVMSGADVSRLREEKNHYMLTLRRLTAEAENIAFKTHDLNEIEKDELEMQLRLYNDRMEEYASRVKVAEKNINQAEENLKQANSIAEKLRIQVKMAGEREKRTHEVAQQGGISNFAWQEYLEKYLSLKQDLSTQQSEILRVEQIIEQGKAELQRIKDERDRDISTQTVEASRNLHITEEELKKAEEKNRLMHIRSPIDGIVQQLEIHTTGAVVTAAQPLLQVVPDTGKLQFEVWAMNRDIGFIYEGQSSEIKVETFNFQKYGTLPGRVKSVATEAKEDEKRGLIYQVFIETSQDHYMVEDRKVQLLPGMAVTGEIKVRRKRIIEYFLDTFKRYVSESLRER